MLIVLLITAMHVNYPEDVPARMTMQFSTIQQCEEARKTINYWIKFKQFKVESECKELQSLPTLGNRK